MSVMTVAFGASKAGLGTVGYIFKNADGTSNGSRITDGVYELAGGCYGADVTIPAGILTGGGSVVWDTGEMVPVYAAEQLDYTVADKTGYSGVATNMVDISGLSTFEASSDTVTIDNPLPTVDEAGNVTANPVYINGTKQTLDALNDAPAVDISALALEATVEALGSPLQAGSYVAPDNSGIAAAQSAAEAAQAAAEAIDVGATLLTYGAATAGNVTEAQEAIVAALPEAPDNTTIGEIADDVDDIKVKTALIVSGGITIISPVATDGSTITLVRGDDYLVEDGRAIIWTAEGRDDIATATVHVYRKGVSAGTIECTVDGITITADVDREFTTALVASSYSYNLEAELDTGSVATLVIGQIKMVAGEPEEES